MGKDSELELILCCLRAFVKQHTQPRIQPIPESLDSERLSRLAIREGVAGIASQCLQGSAFDKIHSAARVVFVRGGAIWSELDRLRDDLESAHIPAVLLKGAALLITDYQGRLSLRPLSDIDLLIHPQDRPAVTALLARHGLVPEGQDSLAYFDLQRAVDLHLDLIGSDRIRSRQRAYRMDMDTLWAASRPWPDAHSAEPGGFRLLAPEHQFLHLAVHALKHSFSRLIWFVDLALTWQRVDPDLLLRQATAFGMQRPLLYSLRGLRELMQIEAVEVPLALLPRSNPLEEMFLQRVARRRTESLGALVQALSVADWKGRLAYLAESAFPRRRIMSQMFPATPPWLRYPLRAACLLRAGTQEISRSVPKQDQ